MSNYTKTTNFAAKDSLPSGNAAKIVKGAEIDTEFNNIATASATKANANNAALTGTTVFETLSDGTIGVTGWVDEDNMSSDSAVLIPTQQSVKAYVDSQVTAQDLDVTDGTTSIDIDLDSESLGILGGTGIDSTASGTGVTLAIDSTVTTLTGTQTLSNKTLTTPVISGALTTNSTIDGRDVAVDGTKLDGIESGATADQTAAEIKTAYESNADTNAFTDADESKLDGIEASADVTDTTNVTAAGALMDSELTSIASVKAMNQGVATTDSPTFAGVTAPITGNVTGNLTGDVTGNVTGDLTGDVTGNVAGNLTGSILTAQQQNITLVGTLDSLRVAGDVMVVEDPQYNVGFDIDVSAHRVSIWTANPTVTLDMGDTQDGIRLPVGTTAQRPTGAAGMFRYNSSLEQFEGYTSEWGSIGGGGGTNTFTTDSFTGNGSTTAYALSQTTSSEDNLLVFIEGVFQQQDAYSIATSSGTTTLTFSAAPANGNAILIYSVASAVSGSNLNIDSMTGDGSDVTLTLSIAPVNENNTQVFIDGVYQSKSNYSISGTTLTFSTAPPTGTAVEVMTFTQTDINVPVDGTITPAKIASGDFYFDTDTLYVDATNNRVGVGTTSPSAPLTINGTNAGIRFTDANQGPSDYYGEIYKDYNGNAPFIIQSKSNGVGVISLNPDGGNVGVGTNSPATQVFVKSAANAANVFAIESADAAQRLQFGVNTSSGGSYIFEQKAQAIRFGTSDTERMRLTSAGKLVVNGTVSGYVGTDITVGSPSESSSGLSILSSTTGVGYVLFGDVTGDASGGYIGQINYAHSTNRMGFNTNNVERLAITDVGAIFASGVRSSATANSDVRYNTSNGEIYYQTSSQRYKSNIVDLEFETSNLYNLRPVSYDDNATGERCFGLIAEDTFEQIPEAVVTRDVDGETVPDSIPYSMLSVIIINEMKKLKVENDSLKERLTALENT